MKAWLAIAVVGVGATVALCKKYGKVEENSTTKEYDENGKLVNYEFKFKASFGK